MAPIRDATVTLPDGRRLAFTEWGLPHGKPVLYCHGAPGSRLWCPDEAATAAAAVRLFIPDRPGIGMSDPLEDRGYGDWPADVAAFADNLALDPFPMVGVSAGGPYAAACAALIPDRLTAVALVSSGPLTSYAWEELPGSIEAWPPEERQQFELLRRDPAGAADLAAERWAGEMGSPEDYVESIHQALMEAEGDRWFFQDPERTAVFDGHIREWWRQLPDGLRWELIDAFHPWGFRLADIAIPVSIWHGAQDPWVSRDHIDHQRAAIPHASLVVWDDGGHLGFAKHFAEILEAVTSPVPQPR